MTERIEYTPKLLHPDRNLVTPMDVFRGSRFVAASLISGAAVSNNLDVLSGGGRMFQVSSPVRARVLNLEVSNREPGWLEVEFRDGGAAGGRVLGPYRIDALADRRLGVDDLIGRYFTSSIHGLVRSGYTAQPLSNGVLVNLSFILEPTDFYE